MKDEAHLPDKAIALRRAFDAAFAEPPQTRLVPLEDFLAVRVAADPYTLPLRQIVGLFAGRRVVPLPSPLVEFLGVAGFRGGIVPVYDLRVLLGYPRGEVPRWLVLLSSPEPIGLAFDRFEGRMRVGQESVAAADHPESARRHVRAVVRMGDTGRPIIDLVSVAEAIKRRTHPDHSLKEQ